MTGDLSIDVRSAVKRLRGHGLLDEGRIRLDVRTQKFPSRGTSVDWSDRLLPMIEVPGCDSERHRDLWDSTRLGDVRLGGWTSFDLREAADGRRLNANTLDRIAVVAKRINVGNLKPAPHPARRAFGIRPNGLSGFHEIPVLEFLIEARSSHFP